MMQGTEYTLAAVVLRKVGGRQLISEVVHGVELDLTYLSPVSYFCSRVPRMAAQLIEAGGLSPSDTLAVQLRARRGRRSWSAQVEVEVSLGASAMAEIEGALPWLVEMVVRSEGLLAVRGGAPEVDAI